MRVTFGWGGPASDNNRAAHGASPCGEKTRENHDICALIMTLREGENRQQVLYFTFRRKIW